ncbi:MAG: dihydrofolate reductase [Planctomycetes bacterium]|nr:dihydrofolate reductase [Planctomycetota bacterium]
MITILIVAMTREGLIGKDGHLPWHEPEDLKHFKRATTGHAIIMGRRTWESIGRPLPDRRSIVVSRTKGYAAQGADVVDSVDAALELCRARCEEKAFVIGGAELYRAALPAVDEMMVTWIERTGLVGDTHFPTWNPAEWNCADEISHPPLRFATYRRKK